MAIQINTPPAKGTLYSVLFLVAFILVALNLRPALSSLAPVLKVVQEQSFISTAQAGLLTTLPVLCLGLFAPVASRLARRFSADRIIPSVLILLGAGLLYRGYGGVTGLYIGTIMAGASIGIIGTLLPVIVKREFPKHSAVMTGVYTMALCLGAAIAAGLTVPLKNLWGHQWQPALAFWAIPALLGAIAWWPFRKSQSNTPKQDSARVVLWKCPIAWYVTLFMGLQSSLAYCVFGWLPSILQDRGISEWQSGLFLSGSVLTQVISSLGAPWLSTFFKDQRAVIVFMLSLTLSGLMGTFYAPVESLWLWMVLLGLGQGGGFAMALTLIVLRSPNPHVATSLSGMAQGIGYSFAALGPFLMGVLHEYFHSWAPVGALLAVIAILGILFGFMAGQNRYVQAQ